MKAWCVFDRHCGPQECCVLLWAYSRNEAKKYGSYQLDIDYVDVGVRRVPSHDADDIKEEVRQGKAIHSNNELVKAGLSPFYNENEVI